MICVHEREMDGSIIAGHIPEILLLHSPVNCRQATEKVIEVNLLCSFSSSLPRDETK